MPFVPTPILGLYDIGHFEEEDAWDSLTDTNWARIERAAHGFGTVSVGSVDVTLDDAPYTGTESIPTSLVVVGPQTNDLTVFLPNKQRQYAIINATSPIAGPWNTFISCAGNPGPSYCRPGERMLVASNGTDVTVVYHSNEAYPKTGGPVTGNITLGDAYRVRNALDGAAPQDYVTVAQLNAAIAASKNAIYPVGSILYSSNPANPATYLAFGTWTAAPPGRVIVSVGNGSDGVTARTFTAGETAGEYNHTLTIGEMPSHTHSGTPNTFAGAGGGSAPYGTGGTSGSTGGGGAHNNMPPYWALYIWWRTS